MKKLLVGAVLLAALSSAPAMADIANGLPEFDWTQPATWNDGSALTAAQITGYQLNCTGTGFAPINKRIAIATGVPPSTTPPAERFQPTTWSCTIAVYGRKTPTSPEVLGTASAPVSFTVPQPTPSAPTGFSVN